MVFDSQLLDEREVCDLSSSILSDLAPRDRVEPEDLVLAFRIARSEQTLQTFDFDIGEPEGRGIGGAEAQWITGIVINVVSSLLWLVATKGVRALRDSETFSLLKQDLLSRAGKARHVVENAIDKARQRILDREGR